MQRFRTRSAAIVAMAIPATFFALVIGLALISGRVQ